MVHRILRKLTELISELANKRTGIVGDRFPFCMAFRTLSHLFIFVNDSNLESLSVTFSLADFDASN